MVNIEIDGKKVQAQDGAMLIEAADDAGVSIPRFCYHKKLSVAANCRMCLVEVEKAAKPLPACATPVTEGMKVFTKSARALAAQKDVMEFLLINHPLDCPICDQGGECDLQDLAVGYGADQSHYGEKKRVVKDKNIGPLISTDMTRCIHCTRCVRFGQEIAGLPEFGGTGRGEHMQIGTYVEKAVSSELSGNVIDLCPVGALTSKPFRFQARSWELTARSSIAAHDCVGSNLVIESLRSTVRRVKPAENESINETWISDRDRFSYEGLNSDERLQLPMIKQDGSWQEVDWETALNFAVAGLKKVLEKHGAGQLGALTSPSSTLEEMYLLQKLVRGLGSSNIDHRLRQTDFSDQDSMPPMPALGCSLQELASLDAILLVGSNVRMEQPIIGHRLRTATLNGGQVMCINSVDYDFNFDCSIKITTSIFGIELALAGIAKALIATEADKAPSGLNALIKDVVVDESHQRIASVLKNEESAAVILGSVALSHPTASTLRSLAQAIADMSGASFGSLTDGSNSAGAWLVGALPHRAVGGKGASYGLNVTGMFEEKLPAYILLNIEPERDCSQSALAMNALGLADFVVNMTAYKSETMQQYANVLLPIAPFSETSGTFVNIEGCWQSFTGSVQPLGETRPAWKVLRVLGNLFALDNFSHISSEEILQEVKAQSEGAVAAEGAWYAFDKLTDEGDELIRLSDMPIYAVDAVVRRASSLQQTNHAAEAVVRVNKSVASALQLTTQRVVVSQGDAQRELAFEIDDRIADGCVWLSGGLSGTSGFGANGTSITLKQA